MHHVIRGASSSNPPQITEAGRYTSQPHVIRGGGHCIHRKLQRPHVIRGSPPSQQKEEASISPILTEEEKKKKEPIAYMPKPPYPQRLKAEKKKTKLQRRNPRKRK
ncbi:hypothetical protein PIB30_073707, partial [Stylosanthes scabra]|nr:hypothetical protein [Stylosanthes scabra]